MKYKSLITWQRNNQSFDEKSFSRTHHIQFGSGHAMDASSAPEYLGDASLPNPEEMFTAAISSCFMLTFLYFAAKSGFLVDDYTAEAVGTLDFNDERKKSMTEVIIKPKITFNAKAPNAAELNELFHKAHENCFISCSVKTKITIEAIN